MLDSIYDQQMELDEFLIIELIPKTKRVLI